MHYALYSQKYNCHYPYCINYIPYTILTAHHKVKKEKIMKTDQGYWAKAAEKWGSAIVARTEFKKFAGGLYSERTLANADCNGTGPKGRFRCGRKILYPVDSLVEWLESRSKAVKEK